MLLASAVTCCKATSTQLASGPWIEQGTFQNIQPHHAVKKQTENIMNNIFP
jgi:hypothetical protein